MKNNVDNKANIDRIIAYEYEWEQSTLPWISCWLLQRSTLWEISAWRQRKFYRQFVPETQDEQTSATLKKDIGMH